MKTRLLSLLLAGCACCALSAADFEFVVIGDTRPPFESENFRIFERLIPEINTLKPAFVINVGDLIYGYGLLRKEKQWDRYQQVIRGFAEPYYQLPGNHDTYSKEARRIYGRRFGKFYESFDHGDCHFVLLDTTEEEKWGYLGPAQLAWLRADLREAKAKMVFVFTHFPLWEPARVAPKYHEFWAQTLHPLFRESRVRAVFGGHFHSYGPTRDIDGIRYFITGGGGAELKPAYKKAGGVHHFLRVSVKGESFDVRVVTDHGELTDAEADVTGGEAFADQHCSRIGLAENASRLEVGTRIPVSLTNPFRDPLNGTAEWLLDAAAWIGAPATNWFEIPPGATKDLEFELAARSATNALATLPQLAFAVRAGPRQLYFRRDVSVLRRLAAPRLPATPALDGRLDEWTAVPALTLDAGTPAAAEVRAFRTAEALHLAVTVPVAVPDEDEDAAFRDDLRIGFARRTSENGFATDRLRFGIAAAGRPGVVHDRTPGRKPGGALAGVKTAWRSEAGKTVYEVSVPWRLLRPARADKLERWVIGLAYPVPAAGAQAEPPAGAASDALNYEVRYGGDAVAPVHFVELVMESPR